MVLCHSGPLFVMEIVLGDKPVAHRGNRRWHLRKGAVTGRSHQSVAMGKTKVRRRKSKSPAERAQGRNVFQAQSSL